MRDVDAGIDHRDPHVVALGHRMRFRQTQLADGILAGIVPRRVGLLQGEAIVALHRADAAVSQQLPRHRIDRAAVRNAPAEHGRADQRKILQFHARQTMPLRERNGLRLGHGAVDLDDDLARHEVSGSDRGRAALRGPLLACILRLLALTAVFRLSNGAPRLLSARPSAKTFKAAVRAAVRIGAEGILRLPAPPPDEPGVRGSML